MEYNIAAGDTEGYAENVFHDSARILSLLNDHKDIPPTLITRFKESVATLHFVHCWHENGHRTTVSSHGMYPYRIYSPS